MALNLGASSILCRGEVSLWDGCYSSLLTTEIFLRAQLGLLRPFRTSFKVTPKDGIDNGGWAAARQLRLVLVLTAVLSAAVAARVLALAGVVPLPGLHGAALWAGMVLAGWELLVMVAALARVSRRRQIRRTYRVPVEIAGVIEGTVMRVVDLTPGGAGVLGPHPIPVGSEVELRLDLPTVAGDLRPARMAYTIWSCRPAGPSRWRMGGTLAARTAADAEALIEHAHVVSSRQRLAASGRLLPGSTADAGVGLHEGPLPVDGTRVAPAAEPRLSAHG
jgi:hypothetical protein